MLKTEDSVTVSCTSLDWVTHTGHRVIRLLKVIAAAEAVCGAERRDDFIRGRALHLWLVPRINCKQDLAGVSKPFLA